MMFVIQSMGEQFTKKAKTVDCLRDLIELHESYTETVYQYCFRKSIDVKLRNGIEQLFNLTAILNEEWKNLRAIDLHGDFTDGEDDIDVSGTVRQIDVVESTYIDCHTCIAQLLSKEVFTKDRSECKGFVVLMFWVELGGELVLMEILLNFCFSGTIVCSV